MKKKISRRKNFVSSPKGSFVDKLRSASTLKVKYGGSYHPIPPTILNQAKLFALHSVNVDYDVFAKENPVPSSSTDRQIQKAFEDFLEGYIESIMPLGNPSSPRAEEVFKLLSKYFNDDDVGTLSRWYPVKSDEVNAKRVMKSGVMKLVHTYLEGEAKLKVHEGAKVAELDRELSKMMNDPEFKKADTEQRKTQLVRSSFVMRPGASKTEIEKVFLNRTVRNIVTLWTTVLVSKILETNGPDLIRAVTDRTSGMTFVELMGTELREGLLTDVAKKLSAQLSNLDLLKTLK